MHDKRPVSAETLQALRHKFGHRRGKHAHYLPRRARGIDEGPEQIEDSPKAQRPAHGRGKTHRGVHFGREQKRNSVLLQTVLHHFGMDVEVEAERGENVARAAFARRRPVAVLRHGNARARNDERRSGRNVERIHSVAARAAGVYRRTRARVDECRLFAHRRSRADNFVDRLALHFEGCKKRRKNRRVDPAVHNFVEDRPAFVERKVRAEVGNLLQCFGCRAHFAFASSRKLASNRLPP